MKAFERGRLHDRGVQWWVNKTRVGNAEVARLSMNFIIPINYSGGDVRKFTQNYYTEFGNEFPCRIILRVFVI